MNGCQAGWRTGRFWGRISTLLIAATMGMTDCVALAAQRPVGDSVVVVAGERYAAGRVKRLLLGNGYRDLWVTPIRVPVLWPDTAAGGLTILREGGGEQTVSLLFLGADSVEYFFRSVDKRQGSTLPEDLRGTVIADIVQDLVSAKHPGSAMVAGALLDAAGVRHPGPRLAVMADHPLLGEHRSTFAGRLGMFEERPEEVAGSASSFRDYPRVIGTERLFERLDESVLDRVDDRAYLAARLMDLLLGDWDRHPDQWRWGQRDRAGVRGWVPIPRDRDNAFSHVDGLVGYVGNRFLPTIVRYEAEYPDLYALVHGAQSIDRRILTSIPRETWVEVAVELRDRLTDEVIDDAVRRLPDDWETVNGESLAAKLRARRDALPLVAARVYEMMASEVEVRGTDGADEALIERMPDGSVHVRLAALERGAEVYYDRVFHPTDTREVRVDLGAGNDRAFVTGEGGEITIRVIGGSGDDHLEDRSLTPDRALTALYDHEGANALVGSPGGDTVIDEREPPSRRAHEPVFEDNAPPARDWGIEASLVTPRLGWRSEIGPVLGLGPRWGRFGFRRHLYAEMFSVAALYAPFHNRIGVEAEMRFPRARIGDEITISALGSGINVTRFHGFGNDTPSIDDTDDYLVWSTDYEVAAAFIERADYGFEASIGPVVRHLEPDVVAGSPASSGTVPGGRPYGVGGLRGSLGVGERDSSGYPRRGFLLRLTADGYPATWGQVDDGFVRGSIAGVGYIPLPTGLDPTLAFRFGAARTQRGAPFQFAPAIGGASTLRGFRTRRYTGDVALNWSAELRARLLRGNLRLVRGEIGAIALIDAGRVLVSGEDSGGWHYGTGGGLWFGMLDRSLTAHVVYAHGEKGGLYAGLGMPF